VREEIKSVFLPQRWRQSEGQSYNRLDASLCFS